MNDAAEKIVGFLNEIGIETRAGDVPDDTFVPGIIVSAGTLIYDEAKMLYPGDLLHEAGHLAVMTRDERAQASDTVNTGPAEEMAAIAWSYAAALYTGVHPSIVFHAEGYKGESRAILDNFSEGLYFGVPTLAWMGMTTETNRAAGKNGMYPKMTKWLRE